MAAVVMAASKDLLGLSARVHQVFSSTTQRPARTLTSVRSPDSAASSVTTREGASGATAQRATSWSLMDAPAKPQVSNKITLEIKLH